MRPLEPGYRRIEFRPKIPSRGLDSVTMNYESVRGLVATRWRRAGGGLELDVTVPPNATGVVYVPAANAASVKEIGGVEAMPASRASGVRLIRTEAGRVEFEVGSGRYQFRVPDLGTAR